MTEYVVFVWPEGYRDRLIKRASAKERGCDWCGEDIQRGELHGAHPQGFAHFCLTCCAEPTHAWPVYEFAKGEVDA